MLMHSKRPFGIKWTFSPNKKPKVDELEKEEKGKEKIQEEPKNLTFPNKPADSVLNQFKQGDVLFGLLEPRNKISKKLKKANFTNIVANTLNSQVVDEVICHTPLDCLYLPERKKRHYLFLHKYKNNLTKPGGRPISKKPKNIPESIAIRRACKLLLNKSETHASHVLTQEIDWEKVCDKEKSGLGITDSELRAAYRDYVRSGNKVNPNILFYNSKNQLMPKPPWEDPEIQPYFENYKKTMKPK
jgi:hypothetical protein